MGNTKLEHGWGWFSSLVYTGLESTQMTYPVLLQGSSGVASHLVNWHSTQSELEITLCMLKGKISFDMRKWSFKVVERAGGGLPQVSMRVLVRRSQLEHSRRSSQTNLKHIVLVSRASLANSNQLGGLN